MDISWNNTIEGKQYFVSVNDHNKLEYSFDNVNPWVGSGCTFEISPNLNDNSWVWEDIKRVFGIEKTQMIYALALTLDIVRVDDLKKRSSVFYEIYNQQLEVVKAKNILI
jgi:hypothetical protein